MLSDNNIEQISDVNNNLIISSDESKEQLTVVQYKVSSEEFMKKKENKSSCESAATSVESVTNLSSPLLDHRIDRTVIEGNVPVAPHSLLPSAQRQAEFSGRHWVVKSNKETNKDTETETEAVTQQSLYKTNYLSEQLDISSYSEWDIRTNNIDESPRAKTNITTPHHLSQQQQKACFHIFKNHENVSTSYDDYTTYDANTITDTILPRDALQAIVDSVLNTSSQPQSSDNDCDSSMIDHFELIHNGHVTGRLGEKIAAKYLDNYLKELFPEQLYNSNWLNTDDETGLPYDFLITLPNGTIKRCEVKTRSHTNEDVNFKIYQWPISHIEICEANRDPTNYCCILIELVMDFSHQTLEIRKIHKVGFDMGLVNSLKALNTQLYLQFNS